MAQVWKTWWEAKQVGGQHFSDLLEQRHPRKDGLITWNDENVARDTHDLMNIIVLPVVVAFVMNFLVNQTLDNFWALVAITVLYFTVDLVWVIMVPHSVKSPMVIKVHHALTLMYLMLPCLYPEFGWGMASCLCVEINTWFLIARRYWRRSTILFSIGFYISWMVIRVILYPYLVYVFFLEYLEKLFWQLDADASGAISRSELMRVSNWWHLVLMAPLLQNALTLLNIKWTFDLLKNTWAEVTRGQKKAHSL